MDFLELIKQKELDAEKRRKYLEKRREILDTVKPIVNFSNKILYEIYYDFKDLAPIIEIAVKMNDIKELTKDPNDERLYHLVKNNLSISEHPLIKEFRKKTNMTENESLFYLQASNYGLNKALKYVQKN